MDAMVGHAEEIDEGKEETLDAALDMEMAATYVKHPVADPTHSALLSSSDTTQAPTPSQLTFAFPGWEIGISKSEKRTTPSVSRIMNDPPNKKAKHVKSSQSLDLVRPHSLASSHDPSVPLEVPLQTPWTMSSWRVCSCD